MENKNFSDVWIDPKKLRQARGRMSQREVAKIVGVEPAQICNLEKGRSNPSVDLLFRLCTLYKVSVDSLRTDSQNFLPAA